ncbi:MAG TPA: DUF2275 domain-containing protein [Verrucomicrobiae bacterium]|nr:DUF2275 domain-containing protein [Verrucomicrobiae bacterium]
MNCDEIQTRLSEYVEKSLDAISAKGIELHVLSCSRCRVEAESLAECMQQVAGLPMVDPPLGFVQRVMAHVRDIDKTPTLWERLFFPLRVKIPLQATAVVLVGALAIVLFQKEEPFNTQESSERGVATIASPTPSEKKNEPSKDSPIVVEPSARDEKTSQSVTPTTESAKQFSQQNQFNKAAAATPAPAKAQPAPPAATQLADETRQEDKKEAPRRAAIPAQEVSTSGEVQRSRGDAFGLGAAVEALRQPSLRPGPFLVERSLSPLSEPSADVEFVVRRRLRERREQKDAASFDAVSQNAEAKRTSPASAAPKTSSLTEIRWFTVPIDHFEQFKKELAAEATIESERTPGVMENDFAQKTGRELLIKVNIISP